MKGRLTVRGVIARSFALSGLTGVPTGTFLVGGARAGTKPFACPIVTVVRRPTVAVFRTTDSACFVDTSGVRGTITVHSTSFDTTGDNTETLEFVLNRCGLTYFPCATIRVGAAKL